MAARPFKVTLILHDDYLEIFPTRPAIERLLTFTQKKMTTPTKGTERIPTKIWAPGRYYGKLQSIYAWQGCWHMVHQFCAEHGWEVELDFTTHRIPMPAPRFDLMRGFRFNQEEKLRAFLGADISGIFDAATRFGKSYLILNTIRAFPGIKTGVVIPGKDLGHQLFTFLQANLGDRDVRMVGGGTKNRNPGEDVTVYLMSSLDKADYDTRLVIVDEVHSLVTDARLEHFRKFRKARFLGFGATASGRFDKRDSVVEGALGPILVSVSYQEARAIGAVDHLVIFAVDWPYDPAMFTNRNASYRNYLWESGRTATFVKRLFHEVIPPAWQTIGFIADESSADFMAARFEDSPDVAMAKKFKNDKERRAFMRLMQENKVSRCLASNIYSQGVTFSDLRVVINLMGGGANTSAVQKPGRVIEVRPGKRCGVMFDFVMRGQGAGTCWQPHNESMARLKLYNEKGYEVVHVRSIEDIQREFQARCL